MGIDIAKLCYSSRAKQVLQMAEAIANSYNGRCIEVEDLAVAVIRVQEIIAGSPNRG